MGWNNSIELSCINHIKSTQIHTHTVAHILNTLQCKPRCILYLQVETNKPGDPLNLAMYCTQRSRPSKPGYELDSNVETQ